jgi:TetR/AcrR family transcriptional regulator, transcriptional repressor for nem operon
VKEKIINSAIVQLRQGGYAEVSFAKVAEELSISRANIHHHFVDKENLVLAILDQFVDTMSHQFSELAASLNGDVKAFVSAIENRVLNFNKENPGCSVCPCIPLLTGSEKIPEKVRDKARQHYINMTAFFVDLIEKSIDKKQIKTVRTATELGGELTTLLAGNIQLARGGILQKGVITGWLKHI